MSAVERWRTCLNAWALPADLLDRAEGSPWEWPEAALARMRRDRDSEPDTATWDVVRGLLGERGTVLDVGAGTGRLAVPLARLGHRVTAVEPSRVMLDEIRSAARGLPVEVVAGSWPEAAARVGHHDVAVSAHVVFDVADIGPFIEALHHSAGAVVIECGPDHPWSGLTPYYLALHDLERPSGPTAEDLVRVIAEVTGTMPATRRWRADRGLRFADGEDLLAVYRRRLVLPSSRTAELQALLEPDIREEDGWLVVGDPTCEVVTLWWRT